MAAAGGEYIGRGGNASSSVYRSQSTSAPVAEEENLKQPIWGPFSAPKGDRRTLGALQRIDLPMKSFRQEDAVDYLIVGIGSAGGVLLQRLARAGFNVVGLEAGPF